MQDPRITVLTTVYNGERYLDEAIESVLAQDFRDYEYIIVDDGSIDSTPLILKRWAERDARIVIERMPQNVGKALALNRGLTLARGQYIGLLDADDLCVGPRLRRQVDLLDREPDVVLVSAHSTIIDADGQWRDHRFVQDPPALFPYLLNFSNALLGAGSQGMFRRDMARDLGGFCEELETSVDYEFWTRLVPYGRVVFLPFVGLRWRNHPQQMSVRRRAIQRLSSLRISRRMLTSFLNRSLSNEEFEAVASVWRQEGRQGVAPLAHRLLCEAHARFACVDSDPVHHRGVRRITATHWFLSAITLVRLGAFREALSHLGYALRWDPLVLAIGLAHLADRIFVRVRRSSMRLKRGGPCEKGKM